MDRKSRRARFSQVQPALAFAAAHLDRDVSLGVLAAQAGVSPFHLHRMFSQVAGETPKAYSLRLRLSRAAVLLSTTDASVLDIALSCGFQSHEAFTRAFRRQFATTPRDFRARGFAVAASDDGAKKTHAAVVEHVAPCLRLFHLPVTTPLLRSDMKYDIVRKDLAAQPVLLVRRRVKRSDIATAIGEALGLVFQYAQQHGVALTGHPITRYLDAGPGLLTIEPGMRIVGPRPSDARVDSGDAPEGTVVERLLPAGPAATTVHEGSYETLPDAYAALETWIGSQGLRAAGAPWESYITDPAQYPNPEDWRTEVFWPVS